jgi:hypothetical protein
MFFGSDLQTYRRQKEVFGKLQGLPLLERLKDIHVGQRAFVIGNGPSLKTVDLQRLQGELSFAANKIFLGYGQTDFRPTYWCCSDQIVAKQNLPIIRTLQHIKIGAFSVEPILSGVPDMTLVKHPPQASGGQGLIADLDFISGVHPGLSVTIFMLKLALWMGVSTVYLMGIDFSFVVPEGGVTEEKLFGNNIIISSGEVNHFHPDYRKPGEKWTMPQLDGQRAEFAVMKWRYEASGGVIYNASRKSELHVFERVDFDRLMA